jgi:hypothetical protein
MAYRVWLTIAAVLFGSGVASAQPLTWASQTPTHEIAVEGSAWLFASGEERSVGGRYTRNLNEAIAVEASLAAGRQGGQPFGLVGAQVRAVWPDPHPMRKFVTVGIATGLAEGSYPKTPRGPGLVVGFGVEPGGRRGALRVGAEFFKFRNQVGALRMTFGAVLFM